MASLHKLFLQAVHKNLVLTKPAVPMQRYRERVRMFCIVLIMLTSMISYYFQPLSLSTYLKANIQG